jgi:hypothetical protein
MIQKVTYSILQHYNAQHNDNQHDDTHQNVFMLAVVAPPTFRFNETTKMLKLSVILKGTSSISPTSKSAADGLRRCQMKLSLRIFIAKFSRQMADRVQGTLTEGEGSLLLS